MQPLYPRDSLPCDSAVRDVLFERNVCLHATGSIASIHNGGRATVENVTYRSVEAHAIWGAEAVGCRGNGCLMLFDFRIVYGKYCSLAAGCTHPNARGDIGDVLLSDVRVHTHGVPFIFSQISGNSSTHSVSGVTFDRFQVDGRRAASLADLNATVNEFVRGVRFGVDAVEEPLPVAVDETAAKSSDRLRHEEADGQVK